MSVDAPSTPVSAADKWIADCFGLVGLDPPNTVEPLSTDLPSAPALP